MITWIVEDSDKLGDLTNLHQSIKNNHSQLILIDHRKTELFYNPMSISPDNFVTIYGSIPFVKKYQRNFLRSKFYPYAHPFLYDVSQWVGVVEEKYINYSDYAVFPLRDKLSIERYAKNIERDGKIFMRPVSGYKTFSGGLIDLSKLNRIIMDNINPEELLVVISSPKELGNEYRFVVAQDKIITGSQYIPDELQIADVHPMWNKAQEIADTLKKGNMWWRRELVYTLDICEQGMIEINSFSCAGLYECDTNKVVKAVNEAVLEDALKFID